METLKYNGDVKALLNVREYTGWDEKNRARVVGEIAKKHTGDDAMLVDGVLGFAPSVSCTSGGIVMADGRKIEVKELTFDEYLALPVRLVGEWLELVHKVNPSWKPDFTADIEEKKT